VRLNADLGLTIVLVEHRLERVLPFVDDLVYLSEDGRVMAHGAPRDVLQHLDSAPPLVTLGKALGWDPLPLTIKEGHRFKGQLARRESARVEPSTPARNGSYLQVRDIEVGYNGHPVLRGVTLDVWPGEIVTLMGRNGSGKTTLLKSIVGLLSPRRGQLVVAGQKVAEQDVAEVCRQVGYLPQDPNALLFADDVREELRITLRNHGMEEDPPIPPAVLLERLRLSGKAGAYPRDLSAGERQRVALGAVTVTRPSALLLDEPTRGLDYAAKEELVALLREWRDEGMAILLVTHDVELAAAAADRVVLMSQGEIIADGSPGQVLGSSPLFASQIARLFPGTGWLTAQDALEELRSQHD
jgi:energy-coupling factor transport system ATP-binding protein